MATSIDLETLRGALELMRDYGIVHLKAGDVEIALAEPLGRLVLPASEATDPSVDTAHAIGLDGLTLEEQEDLYMRPVGDQDIAKLAFYEPEES